MGIHAFGQPVPRTEDPRLLTGQGRFIADWPADGHLCLALLRSPHPHAAIGAIDRAAALAAPGVRAVITAADLRAVGAIPGKGDLIRLPGTDPARVVMRRRHHPALAGDVARYVGQPVAAVVADNEAAALDAIEALTVDWRPLAAVIDPSTALAADAPLVWPDLPGNVAFEWSAGDAARVGDAFRRAHRIVETTLVNNRVVVGALENRGALGSFDAETGRYTLVTPTQMPHGLKSALAQVFALPDDRFRVLVPEVGGSFGIKNTLYPEQILVLWASRALGRPVRWLASRTEAFLADYQARDVVSHARLALDTEGRMLALDVANHANLGAFVAPSGHLSPTANSPALAGVYRLPAIHVAVTGVYTNTAPTEVYRGAGRPEATHLLERLVDKAAAALGRDPAAFRRLNMIAPADLPYATQLGLVYDSGDFPGLQSAAESESDRPGFAARQADSRARGLLRGRGVAQYCERVAVGIPEYAWVELGPDGRLTVLIGTQPNGQGHETAYAQLLAAELGLDMDLIAVVQGDTDRVPKGNGTGGSRSLAAGGAALAAAGADLVRRMTGLAADLLEAAPSDIAYADGRFRVDGTDRAVAWRAVAASLGRDGRPDKLVGHADFTPPSPTFPNGCHVAEVEIDPETGEVTLAAYRMVHDVGRVLNPLLLQGQLQGGVVQGIGQALHEQVVHDPVSGQPLTGSLMDYRLPRARDLPDLPLTTRATPAPSSPIGVKGCGEAGAAGAPPAVMNAILDALAPLGLDHLDMPATPERVWRAI
jgi:carbon-monoxide dehydrogenase large subunit